MHKLHSLRRNALLQSNEPIGEHDEIESPWLLRKEAAAYPRLSLSTLAHMACDGHGPRYFRVGRLTRYRKVDLDAWAESRCRETLPLAIQKSVRRPSRRSWR